MAKTDVSILGMLIQTRSGFMVGGPWAPSSMKLRKHETSYIDIQFTTNMSTHGQAAGPRYHGLVAYIQQNPFPTALEAGSPRSGRPQARV